MHEAFCNISRWNWFHNGDPLFTTIYYIGMMDWFQNGPVCIIGCSEWDRRVSLRSTQWPYNDVDLGYITSVQSKYWSKGYLSTKIPRPLEIPCHCDGSYLPTSKVLDPLIVASNTIRVTVDWALNRILMLNSCLTIIRIDYISNQLDIRGAPK